MTRDYLLLENGEYLLQENGERIALESYSFSLPAATTGTKSFGRTDRQGEIWTELNAIRDHVGAGLLSPEDGELDDGEEVWLQDEWEILVSEYDAIHEAERTFG